MAFTFFFRDMHVLDLIARHVIPGLVGLNTVKVWDAGCAMGPEPYSLAMVFAENVGRFGFRNLRIQATDIDEGGDFEQTVTSGVFPGDLLQRLPDGFLARYFEPAEKPGHYRISRFLRQSVAFARHDLLSLTPVGEGFHLVLCKNVLLHFQPAERAEVLRMFHRSLAPGGYLATEQTQKMPEEMLPLLERVAPDGQLFRKRAD